MPVTMQSVSNNSYIVQNSATTTFQSFCEVQTMTKNLWSIFWKSNLYHMFSMAFSKNNCILFSSTQIDDIYLSLCLIVRIVVSCFLAYKLLTNISHSTCVHFTNSLGFLSINQHELSRLNEFGGYRKSGAIFFSPIHTFMKDWVKSNEQETEAKQQYIKFDTFFWEVALVFHFIIYKKEKKKRIRLCSRYKIFSSWLY